MLQPRLGTQYPPQEMINDAAQARMIHSFGQSFCKSP